MTKPRELPRAAGPDRIRAGPPNLHQGPLRPCIQIQPDDAVLAVVSLNARDGAYIGHHVAVGGEDRQGVVHRVGGKLSERPCSTCRHLAQNDLPKCAVMEALGLSLEGVDAANELMALDIGGTAQARREHNAASIHAPADAIGGIF